MDDNTTKVIMAVIALISAVVTPLVVVFVTKMQNKLIAKNQIETKEEIGAVKGEIGVVKEDVKEYRKEVNGHMTKLLETTGQLATANEKVRAQSEDSSSTPTTIEGKGIKKDLAQAKEKSIETTKKIENVKKKLDEI